MQKNTGILSSAIHSYLLEHIEEDDRKRGVEIYSPSLISKGCLIALILDKLNFNEYSKIPTPTTRLIFMNGDDVHERLQTLSKKSGVLKLAEVAVKHPTCGMYGTTDGLIYLDKTDEIVIAEYKTMNTNMFDNSLKGGALDSHVGQSTMYAGMMEIRRKQLRKKYKTEQQFYDSVPDRIKYYKREYFNHVKSGRKYTRLQKLKNLINIALKADELLWRCPNPIKRITILYENKNNQQHKEFEYTVNQEQFESFVQLCVDTAKWLKEHPKADADNIEYLQRKRQILPERNPDYYKSCSSCQYCPHKAFCYEFVEEGVKDEKKQKKKGKRAKTKNPIEKAKQRKKKRKTSRR